MKRNHIIFLVLIAAAVVALFTFAVGDFSTRDSISSAKKKPGKSVSIVAYLDKSAPIEYDPATNAGYIAFYAIDSTGGRTKVIYHKEKPTDFEKCESIVMKGKMQGEVFECSEMMLKCPSKYTDDKKILENSISSN